MRLLAALAITALPAAAPIQTSVGPNGLRAPGVRIDATGVHTATTDVSARGVRVGNAHSRGGSTSIDGNNGRRLVDCAGGSLAVNGNNNRLEVTRCPVVTVSGNNNQVHVRFVAAGRLAVPGNGNRVSYSAPARARVTTAVAGSHDAVARE